MKKTRNSDLLIFSLFTLMVVATWTGLDVYRAYSKAEAPKVTPEELLDLDPKLDLMTLQNLEGRKEYTEGEIGNLVQNLSPAVTVSAGTETVTNNGQLETGTGSGPGGL